MREFSILRLVVLAALLQYSSCNSVRSSVRSQHPTTEGRPFDFLSSLSTFRTNILSLLGNNLGFNQNKKVRPPLLPPPVRPSTFHHVNLRPPPAPAGQPGQPGQGIFVTSSPHLSQSQGQAHHNTHFHSSPPQPLTFTQGLSVSLPQAQPQPQPQPHHNTHNVQSGSPIVEVNIPAVSVKDTPSENVHIEPPTIQGGPVSFVDSERLNAGSDLLNEIDHNALVHIPKELWREDIGKIEHKLKIHKKIKFQRRLKKQPETSTPVQPGLLIE